MKAEIVRVFLDWFSKYIGLQGLMALLMLGVYLYATVTSLQLDEKFTSLMTLIIGYYFAKNGITVLGALRGVAPARRKDD